MYSTSSIGPEIRNCWAATTKLNLHGQEVGEAGDVSLAKHFDCQLQTSTPQFHDFLAPKKLSINQFSYRWLGFSSYE